MIGSNTWLRQRLSALILIPLAIWFQFDILRHIDAEYPAVLAWAAQPWISISLAFLIGILLYHSSVGFQVIVEDYIPNPFWQRTFILMIKLGNLALALLAWFFILQIVLMDKG